MCLAVPMRVVEIDGLVARCEARGINRDVSLFLLQDSLPAIGDHVMVHVGHAIQVIAEDEADDAWSLLDEIIAHDA